MLLPPDIAAAMDAEFDALAPEIDEGLGILQVWEDPPQVQIRRRDATSGNFANAGTAFKPVRVRLADRMEQSTGANAGIVSIVNGGELWVRPARDIRRDDRFNLNGVTCEVTLVEAPTRIKQVVQFRYLGG